jgi:hypothetical protein
MNMQTNIENEQACEISRNYVIKKDGEYFIH